MLLAHAVHSAASLFVLATDILSFGAHRTERISVQGEEIGELVVQAVQDGVVEKQPWYEPLNKLPVEPIINANMPEEFDAVVVDGPKRWATAAE